LAWLKVQDRSKGGPMIGLGPFHGQWPAFMETVGSFGKDIPGKRKYFCLDFSRFDQSLHKDILSAAFDIVQATFVPEEGHKSYWNFARNNLINTNILGFDGHIYRKGHGIASGDPWTSIIGSWANWLILTTIFKELGVPDDHFSAWTFGDDSIVAVIGHDITLEMVQIQAKAMYMDISVTKSKVCDSIYSPDFTFLGNSNDESLMPVKPTEDTLMKLLIPEYWFEECIVEWKLARVYSAYILTYWNPELHILCEQLWLTLIEKYRPRPLDRLDPSTYELLKTIPENMISTLLLLELPTDGTIIELYTV
jgi:hypothetical protein